MVRYCEKNGDLDVVGEGRKRIGLWMKIGPVRNIEEWKWKERGKKDAWDMDKERLEKKGENGKR